VASIALVAALLAISFIPPLLLVVRLRNAERSRREPWRAIRRAFLWGAVGATLVAIFAESALASALGDPMIFGISSLAIVLAPTIEEVAKAMGLLLVADADAEPEDGLIYGAVAGLGFAATENAAYIAGAFLLGGGDLAITTAIYRGIATVALHASATALSGYGIWAARYRTVQGSWVASLVAAILLHAVYNLLASLDLALAMVAALLLAVVTFSGIFKRIRRLDAAVA
jgi:RsiW-degrading membrane proteinase PrsW (M82 family)